MFVNQLNNFIVWKALVPKFLRTKLWKLFLRKEIIKSLKKSEDKEIIEVINFLKKNELRIFPYNFIFKYKEQEIEVHFDEYINLKFVYLTKTKKLFFKSLPSLAVKIVFFSITAAINAFII